MPREKVVFTPNVAVQVALKYPMGKLVTGTFGDQVYYTTADDKAMYLDLAVGQKVNEMAPKPGELLVITKRWSGRKGDQANWTVERAQPELPRPDPGDQLQEQLYGSIAAARSRKLGEQGDGTFAISSGASATTPAPARAASQQPLSGNNGNINADLVLAEAKHLTDVFAAAWKYAADRYEGRVKPDDVRSFVITSYIQRTKGGGSYAA